MYVVFWFIYLTETLYNMCIYVGKFIFFKYMFLKVMNVLKLGIY